MTPDDIEYLAKQAAIFLDASKRIHRELTRYQTTECRDLDNTESVIMEELCHVSDAMTMIRERICYLQGWAAACETREQEDTQGVAAP